MEKISCKICGKLCVRVCTHARQAHEISAREYKQEFGYDVKKGIMTDRDREHMRELAFLNGMPERLKEAGKNSRFKPKQPGLGKYSRSQQTMERLKYHGKNFLPHTKSSKVSYQIICPICGTEKTVYYKGAKFCSRHCSTINRNKMQKTF